MSDIKAASIGAKDYLVQSANQALKGFEAPKGFYPISDAFINNQPRIPMAVYLKEAPVKGAFL
jgi:hypothetical protein